MMNAERTTRFISEDNFGKLLDSLSRAGTVFAPEAVDDRRGNMNYRYRPWNEGMKFVHYGYRPSQPLKTFLFRSRVKVAEYPASADTVQKLSDEKIFIVGAAACDVLSLKSLDVLFLQDEFTDIFYRVRRENTVLISIDCTEPRETCFCTLAGHGPHPESGYDLNIAKTEGGYIIESGSDTGEAILGDNETLLSDASPSAIHTRDEQRRETAEKVRNRNREYELGGTRHDILQAQRESDEWYDHVRTCIECGACLFACPTCHCFLLQDQPAANEGYERIKKWDACAYAGYSRMSGGSSPRLGLMERFRHRYLHKLEYYPKNFDFEACTGCGRCIEGCMGKIDMRKVLKALDSIATGVGDR